MNSAIQPLTFVGNVPELKVSLSVDTIEHQEAQSGQRLTDLQLIKTKKGEFACTLEELIATNLALALYGTTTTITPGTVTGELLPNPVTPGSLYPLTMQNVSAVQVQDSDATPKTLPGQPVQRQCQARFAGGAGCHVRRPVHRAVHRRLRLWRGAEHGDVHPSRLPERWIRFEGLNTADGNREVVIDLYRVAINPAKELSIITDELLKFELSGQVLADLTKPVGGDLGQFGRLVLL